MQRQSEQIAKETQDNSLKFTMHPQMSSIAHDDVRDCIERTSFFKNLVQRSEIAELNKFSDKFAGKREWSSFFT